MESTVRGHGGPPYAVACVHGGPGAPGSAYALAEALSSALGIGVLEPLQTRDGIDGLLDELTAQLRGHASLPVTLIGHSWGAWLIALLCARDSGIARRMIMVGAGPLEAEYVPQIHARRMANLLPEEAEELDALLKDTSAPGALSRIGALCAKADSVSPLPDVTGPPTQVDSAAYASVWAEADAMRRSGALLDAFSRIQCPIVLLHGEQDPHPAEGLWGPLTRRGIPFEGHLLPRCGHDPWKERHAKDAFLRLIADPIDP